MEKFKAGDLVKLKSGGPTMTVSKYASRTTVDTTWFDKDDKPQFGRYAEDALNKVEEKV